MRLLNVQTFRLEDFSHDTIPSYAILSHTWGNDSEEVQYRHLTGENSTLHVEQWPKLKGACMQAREDNPKYIWIDSCCIDNSSSAELSESINCMFRWYQRAAICYTYVADVTVADDDIEQQVQSKLASSRWFTRGWTLQELLAPEILRFFDSNWRFFGTKGSLCLAIETITSIPHEHLQSIKDISEASVAQRMSWAAKRVTRKEEDMAYCLLGIFGVTMPAIYGEGGDKAFRRLQEEILKTPSTTTLSYPGV